VKMTIWVDKSGADLDVGESETGSGPNSFAYNSGAIDGTFAREPDFNSYAFPLGVTVNHNNDFFGRIDFSITSLSYSGVAPIGTIGFIRQSDDTAKKNTIGFEFQTTTNYGIYLYDHYGAIKFDIENSSIGTGDFYVKIVHQASIHTVTISLYNSVDTLLDTFSVDTITAIYIEDIGLYNFDGPSVGEYDTPIKITKVKANSGLVEEFASEDEVINNVSQTMAMMVTGR